MTALAKRFRNREVAFLEDLEVSSNIQKVRRGPEFADFATIGNREQRAIIALGLALRRQAQEGNPLKIADTRARIHRKYGAKGLHLAQAAQAELLTAIMAELKKRATSTADYETQMKRVLDHIEDYVLFIMEGDNPDRAAETTSSKLRRDIPPIFIIAGSGKAVPIASEAAFVVSRQIKTYQVSRTSGEHRVHFTFVSDAW